jgi:hypothetical protein
VIDSYTLELKDIELDEIENNYNIAIKIEKLATLKDNYDAAKEKFEKYIFDYKVEVAKVKMMIDNQVSKYNEFIDS